MEAAKTIVDPLIFKAILWCLGGLISILGLIGTLSVKALFKMSSDLNEIKINIKEISTKHDGLEKRVEALEDKL